MADEINIKVTATTDAARIAFRDVSKEMAQMSAAFQGTSKEAANFDSQLARLMSRIDPVYAAEKKLSDATGLLDENLRLGNISAETHASMLSKVEGHYGATAEGGNKLSFATAGATREFIVLGHEVVSGNFSRIPGSLIVLGERMGGLSLATIGTTAAFAAGAFALYEWASNAEHAAEAINEIQAAQSGYSQAVPLSKKQIEDLIETLRKLPGVNREAAESLIGEFSRAHNISGPQMQQLAAVAVDMAYVTGTTIPQAAKRLTRDLSDTTEGVKSLEKEFALFTPEQLAAINHFNQFGDTAKAANIILEAVTAHFQNARIDGLTPFEKSLDSVTRSYQEFVKWANTPVMIGGVDTDTVKHSRPSSLSDDDAAKGVAESIAAKAQAERNTAVKAGIELEDKLGLLISHRTSLEGQLAQIQASKRAAEENGNAEMVKRFTADAAEIQLRISQLHEKGALSGGDAWHAELEKMKADHDVSKEEELTFWQAKVAIAGSGTKQYLTALREVNRLTKEISSEQRTIHAQDLQESARAAGDEYALAREELDLKRQMKQISGAEEYTELAALKDKEYQLQKAALQQELALYDQGSKQRDKINNQLATLERRHVLDTTKLNNQATEDTRKRWESIARPINAALTSAFRGVITGSQTLQQALATVADSLLSKMLSTGLEIAENWLMSQLLIKGVSEATAVSTGMGVIAAHAAEAGAAAFASTAAIPIIGPELAPAAAAAAYGATMAFQGALAIPSAAGGWDVPHDTMAMVHEDEMILPAHISEKIRNMTSPGQGAPTINLHVSAIDGASVKKLFLENGAAIAQAMNKEIRHFNPNSPMWKAA